MMLCSARIPASRMTGLTGASHVASRMAFLFVIAVAVAQLSAQEDVTELEERAFRAAVDRVTPSVVRIETIGGLEKVGNVLVGEGPTTGLIVGEEGYIVSSAFNFVQLPASILVTLPDGKRAAAQIVARDSNRMLVLLKVNTPEKLVVPAPVPLSEMVPGQWAIAVGRTFEPNVPNASVGILSATNRIWGKAIQTDAKVSPSNYGGPLVDIHGRVFGILVPLSAQAHGERPELAGSELYDSGIGFAVPLADILARLDRWKKGEELKPGLLGVALKGRDVNSDEAEIGHVQLKSPAAQAGLKIGDKIVEVSGTKIGRLGELRHAIGRYYAGEKLTLVVARGTEKISSELTLADKIDPYAHPFVGVLPRRGPSDKPGVGVRWVYPSSGADKAGLKIDDRITSCGGKAVSTARELQDAAAAVEPGGKLALTVLRGSETLNLEVTTSALPTEVPAELPAATVGPIPPAAQRPVVGEVPIRLSEETNECLAYVPENYNPSSPCGLVVWLHAPGGYDSKELVALWKPLCEQFGLILLAPKAADPKRWQPGEVEFVRKTLDEVMRGYAVDPSRVVVHGYQAGGAMAWAVALARREVIRGVATVDAVAPLRAQLPENDPFQRFAVYSSASPKSTVATPLEALMKRLRELKFPVTVKQQTDNNYLSADGMRELLRWVDTLDRI